MREGGVKRKATEMTYEEARSAMAAVGQEHIFKFWDTLDQTARAALLAQVSRIHLDDLAMLRGVLEKEHSGAAEASAAAATISEMKPAPVVELTAGQRAEMAEIGERELRAGHVAALVVAGGQGSRLGFDGPKGCYPVGPVTNAPLFAFHARKILALRNAFGAPVPFCVMTSETNDAATRAFFRDNDFFGLPEGEVFFFVQGMWPALTPDGKMLLDTPGHVFTAPDGHGGVLSALERSGVLARLRALGVTTMFYFQVDNPMVDVADPAFIGLHVARGADVSIKVCAKRDPQEGLGVAVERGGKTQIVEYTEFTDAQKNERLPDGELRYKFGSVAIHVFSIDFLEREARAGLPVHVAHKKVPHVDDSGAVVKPSSPNACKFEKFVFDSLLDAKTCVCLAFDREEEFSPVKNAEGSDSPATCRADLSRKWARWLAACGVQIPVGADGYPERPVEIDPAFARDSASLASALARNPRDIPPEGGVLLKA